MYLTIYEAISFGAIVFCCGCLLQCLIDYYLLHRLENILAKEMEKDAADR